MALEAGRRLGAFEILGPVGAGGMGEVYRAKDTRLDRTVALKVLPSELSANPALRERLERPLTEIGTILGTYPYMAPEQLEGKEVDGRADLFAFGAMLHEMVTGHRAFEGESRASLIAAILERDPPPVSTLQPLSPPGLDHVVQTSLAKDPDERWQSAKDLASALRWIKEAGSQAGTPAPVARRRKTRERLAWALSAVLLLALGAGGHWA